MQGVELLPPSHFAVVLSQQQQKQERQPPPSRTRNNGGDCRVDGEGADKRLDYAQNGAAIRNDAATGQTRTIDHGGKNDGRGLGYRECPGGAAAPPVALSRRLCENEEQELARSLARCQKIDKSLQYYSDVRKKWSEEPSSPSRQPQSSVTHSSSPSRDAINTRRACSTKALAPPTFPDTSSSSSKDEQISFRVPAAERQRRVVTKQTFNDLGSLPTRRNWHKTPPVNNARKPNATLVLKLYQPTADTPRPEQSSTSYNRRVTRDDSVAVQMPCQPLPLKESQKTTTTHNDTVIAQVLQAEEECRAGIPLIPNTSNDFAIAQKMQKDFDHQVRHTKPQTLHTHSSSSSSSAAVGRGHPIATQHPIGKGETSQREEIRRGAYRGHLLEDCDGDDGRMSHRNRLMIERFQQHEAGSSQAVPPPQAVRQILGLRECGLNSLVIERMSHQYVYKEKPEPYKDPSPQPITECAVCLDKFHTDEPLRLMPCSHTFHRNCVDRWLEKNTICPVCKADYHKLCEKMGIKI